MSQMSRFMNRLAARTAAGTPARGEAHLLSFRDHRLRLVYNTIDWGTFIVATILCIMLFIASCVVQDTEFITQYPGVFAGEILMIAFVPSFLTLVFIWTRRSPIWPTILATIGLAASAALLHVLFQASGYYTYWFGPAPPQRTARRLLSTLLLGPHNDHTAFETPYTQPVAAYAAAGASFTHMLQASVGVLHALALAVVGAHASSAPDVLQPGLDVTMGASSAAHHSSSTSWLGKAGSHSDHPSPLWMVTHGSEGHARSLLGPPRIDVRELRVLYRFINYGTIAATAILLIMLAIAAYKVRNDQYIKEYPHNFYLETFLLAILPSLLSAVFIWSRSAPVGGTVWVLTFTALLLAVLQYLFQLSGYYAHWYGEPQAPRTSVMGLTERPKGVPGHTPADGQPGHHPETGGGAEGGAVGAQEPGTAGAAPSVSTAAHKLASAAGRAMGGGGGGGGKAGSGQGLAPEPAGPLRMDRDEEQGRSWAAL